MKENKPESKIKGLVKLRKENRGLLPKCENCSCQRYSPCMCMRKKV